MRSKLESLFQTDKFSYFIRYVAVFTLIFGSMTIIILQLMRSTVYQNTDDSLSIFAANPAMMVEVAAARGSGADVDIILDKGKDTDRAFQPSSKMKLHANFHVILYDEEGTILNDVDNFSGLSGLTLQTSTLGEITERNLLNPFGEYEVYRSATVKVSNPLVFRGSRVAYASALINTTQLKTSIALHESTVIWVMISFWLISLVASIYLSVLSVRPLLASFQKQKEFVENASHELRTPLAVLQNRLESLFRKPEATIMESSESIAASLEEVRNMRRLTSNLLHLARRDDGFKPEMGEVTPDFFEELVESYQMMAEEQEKSFEAHILFSSPIRSDKILLKQLVTILVDNAIKYTGQDGHIGLTMQLKEKYLFIEVADNGTGISPEAKKKIFDRFYRVDKARTRQAGGFGLGLSLAKQIVTSLGGTITVKDNLPKGSLFQVKLPR